MAYHSSVNGVLVTTRKGYHLLVSITSPLPVLPTHPNVPIFPQVKRGPGSLYGWGNGTVGCFGGASKPDGRLAIPAAAAGNKHVVCFTEVRLHTLLAYCSFLFC